jgi:hypothetical protein
MVPLLPALSLVLGRGWAAAGSFAGLSNSFVGALQAVSCSRQTHPVPLVVASGDRMDRCVSTKKETVQGMPFCNVQGCCNVAAPSPEGGTGMTLDCR